MMYRITKQFTFDASHQLFGLPEGHKCGRLHGHTYRVEVELTGNVDSVGFIRDYADLDELKHFLDTQWDHRHLNDVVPPVLGVLNNTTAECLAKFLYDYCMAGLDIPEVSAVRVSETRKTWAEYRP